MALVSSGFQSLIGYAEVKPKPTYFGIPTSCANLKATGHTSSGLYSVMGTAKVESIFCDFTKLPSDASKFQKNQNNYRLVKIEFHQTTGFQKWIGYNDVKSAAAYFYVQRSVHFNQIKTPIPFDVEKLNAGGAFNLNSGKFTTPVKGKYFFTASGIPSFPASSSGRQLMDFGLYKNGSLIGQAHSDEMHSTASLHETFSLQSTLELQKGDQIWLQIESMTTDADLHGDGYFHFSGFILEEELIL